MCERLGAVARDIAIVNGCVAGVHAMDALGRGATAGWHLTFYYSPRNARTVQRVEKVRLKQAAMRWLGDLLN
jgi:hypothetical protein